MAGFGDGLAPGSADHSYRYSIFADDGRLSCVRALHRVGLSRAGKRYSRIKTVESFTAQRTPTGRIAFREYANRLGSGRKFFGLPVTAGLISMSCFVMGNRDYWGTPVEYPQGVMEDGVLDPYLTDAFGQAASELFPLLVDRRDWWTRSLPGALANAPDLVSAATEMFGPGTGPRVPGLMGEASVGQIVLAHAAGRRLWPDLVERWLAEAPLVVAQHTPRAYRRVFAGCDLDSLVKVLWSSGGPDFEDQHLALGLAAEIGTIPIRHASSWSDVAWDYQATQLQRAGHTSPA